MIEKLINKFCFCLFVCFYSRSVVSLIYHNLFIHFFLFIYMFFLFFSVVPLGSIPELPAKSCAEIKASEGKAMADSNHWIYSNGDDAIHATCRGKQFLYVF